MATHLCPLAISVGIATVFCSDEWILEQSILKLIKWAMMKFELIEYIYTFSFSYDGDGEVLNLMANICLLSINRYSYTINRYSYTVHDGLDLNAVNVDNYFKFGTLIIYTKLSVVSLHVTWRARSLHIYDMFWKLIKICNTNSKHAYDCSNWSNPLL